MANKTKAFKKFASSGKLKDTIKSRRSHQQKQRKFDEKVTQRKKQRGAAKVDGLAPSDDEEEGQDDKEDKREINMMHKGGRAGGVARTVDELFGGNLEGDLEEGSDLEGLSEVSSEDEGEGEEDAEGNEDEEEDMILNEAAMKKAMKDLEKNDPEFFKYLKENDKELLDFEMEGKGKGKGRADDDDDDEEGDDEDEDMEEQDSDDEDEDEDDDMVEVGEKRKVPVTMKMIKQWQQGMLKQYSIRSLRNTALAFRAAAHMNEEDANEGAGSETKYTITSAQVFNKLVVTALKFTPVVVAHHMPYKTQATGKVKLQPIKKPNPTLNRLILSHLSTILHLIKTLPSTPSSVSGDKKTENDAGGLLLVAVNESARMLPWVLSARKHLRAYLKTLLELWSSASDNVRIAAFLAIRKMFVAGDDAVKDLCLKNIYKSLLPPLRNTTPYTLPSLNLMKNTASELFQLSQQQSYTHAFTSIRMLAVHLRGVVRGTTSGKAGENQEAFRSVYNWQFVHCLDFWERVLGSACDLTLLKENAGVESALKPLVYPLVQIALGVVRLLPSSRYFPLRFHILTSLIRLISRTGTYIPLSPFLLELLDSTEFARSNPKKSTLKPLDFEYIIRAPAAYPKTRIYQESLADELVFLLAEYHTVISTNIAFPEISLPIIMTIKRHIKRGSAGNPKVQNQLKGLVEKLEATRTWVENKRRNVSFSPRDRSEVGRFLDGVSVDTSPIGGWTKVQRKVRDRKRAEVEKALRDKQEVESSDEE